MSYPRSSLPLVSLVPVLAWVLAAALPLRAQITPDPLNTHYLDDSGTLTPLIGMSSEYLPHVTRPAKSGSLCSWESYLSCLNNLETNGLNKMQVWLSVDSSTGQLDCNTVNAKNPNTPVAVPYDYEQPFFWNGSKWRLDRYEPNFWTRLNQVISDAASRGIVVEVTLFAPSGGDPSSPWNANNNVVVNHASNCGGSAAFTSDVYLTSFDNSTMSSDQNVANQCARTQQLNLVTQAAQQLNGNTNFYWELANEPATSSDPIALINWYDKIAATIEAAESSLPHQHKMAINVTNTNVMDKLVQKAASLDSNIIVVNGHYVDTALPLIKHYFSSSSPGSLAFGFNEGRSTTCPNLVGARAEAWEFMFNEAATYDNYNLAWNDPNTASIQGWLKNLKSFLSPLALGVFNGPQTGSTPVWASNLTAYGTPDGTGTNFYWSAMQATRSQYALYMHHSTIPTHCVSSGLRYAPPATCPVPGALSGFQSSMNLTLGSQAGHFKAEWIFPSTGTVACTQDLNWTPGSPIPVTSPHYRYDLALRITHCSGSGACAPVTDCSTTAADSCPPPDPLQNNSCVCPAPPPPHCPTPGVPSSCPYGKPACSG